MRLLVGLFATVLASGCGALGGSSQFDGGSGDAGFADGGSMQPPDAGSTVVRDAGSADASTFDAGTVTIDAAVVDAGDPFGTGGFASTQMTLTVSRGFAVSAIAGRAGEVYAVTNADLVRSTGEDPFTVVRLPALSNTPFLIDLHVAADGSVFVLGEHEIFTCRSGCSAGLSAFTSLKLPTPQTAQSMCGRSSGHVYVVTDDGTVYWRAMLWEYDGTSWALVNSNLGVGNPVGCTVSNAGEVVVAAMGGVAFYSNGASTVASPSLPPLTQNEADRHTWVAVTTIGTEVWVGGESLRTLHRDHTGGWTYFHFDAAVSAYKAMIAIAADEIYAGGTADREGINLRRIKGAEWVDGPVVLAIQTINDFYSPSPNVLYVVGSTRHNEPAIERLTR